MMSPSEAPGHEVEVAWRGRTALAWVPSPLAERDLTLTESTVRRTEQAAARARRADAALPEAWEPLARVLLRAEGTSSSEFEGIVAPLEEVALAELASSRDGTAAEVASNLGALRHALDESAGAPLLPAALHRWHATLMATARHLPDHLVGAPRDVQGWIGGTSPLDAALVTPPPEYLGDLLDDLVAFVNRDDVDAVTQAAVAHAQFETIHPYADGNGRLGRILIAWILTRRLHLITPPPVSLRIAADRGGYLSGLTLFRLGQLDAWVRWFAEVVGDAGDSQVALLRAIGDLQDRWSRRLGRVRSDAVAHRALALLPQRPVLTASTVAEALDVSERSGRSALETLAEHGIIEPYQPTARARGRPRRWWVAAELLSLSAAAGSSLHPQGGTVDRPR